MFFASNLQPEFTQDFAAFPTKLAQTAASVEPSTSSPSRSPMTTLDAFVSGNVSPPSNPASDATPPLSPAPLTPAAVPASRGAAEDALRGAARSGFKNALQRRPRDVRIMRSALKLAERAKLPEDELLPMKEALAAEERMAQARSALEAAFDLVPADAEALRAAIAEGQAAGLEDRELEAARQELPPEAPPRNVEGKSDSPSDQNFEAID